MADTEQSERACQIADTQTPAALVAWIAPRLAGTAADGQPQPLAPSTFSAAPASSAPPRVLWVERGDEALVHLDSVVVRIAKAALLISVDLETDQTGRHPLIVSLAMGGADGAAGLICTTDELPRGPATLAARWGRAVQDAIWAALVDLAQAHAAERGTFTRGFALAPRAVQLLAGPPPSTAPSPRRRNKIP